MSVLACAGTTFPFDTAAVISPSQGIKVLNTGQCQRGTAYRRFTPTRPAVRVFALSVQSVHPHGVDGLSLRVRSLRAPEQIIFVASFL